MTIASFLGVLGVLGFVLALLIVTLRLLKRYAPFATGTNQRVTLEVVQRLPLGPRQSIAVVRIGEKFIAVSVGDGGVRRVADVTAPAAERPSVDGPAVDGVAQRPSFRDALSRSFRIGAAVLLVAGAVHALPAQQPDATKRPGATAAKKADSATAKLPAATRGKAPATAQAKTPATTPAKTPATAQSKAPAKPTVRSAIADTMLSKLAPRLDLRVGNESAGGLRLSGTVGIVVMMGLLTLMPTLVLMMTGFTRIFIVLGFLRQALGTQSAPPTQLVAGLALLLTGFVMAPTLEQVNASRPSSPGWTARSSRAPCWRRASSHFARSCFARRASMTSRCSWTSAASPASPAWRTCRWSC